MKHRSILPALVMLLLLLLAQSAQAQGSVLEPRINIDVIRDNVYKIAAGAFYISLLLVIGVAIFKMLYGRVLIGTGTYGVAGRGYQEKWEAIFSVVWYFLTVFVIFPFVLYVFALAGVFPPWVKAELERFFSYIFLQYSPP